MDIDKPRINYEIDWKEFNPEWNEHYNPVTQMRYDCSLKIQKLQGDILDTIRELKAEINELKAEKSRN